MKPAFPHSPFGQAHTQDVWATLTAALDKTLLGFYAGTRASLRRAARLTLMLLPLMMLLAASCKTADSPAAYGGSDSADQVRIALFPDKVKFKGQDYHPAEGYISRAQKLVAQDPAMLEVLTEEEIGFLFGKPAFTRRDASAEIWQYKGDGCVIDFYFYNQAGREAESPVSYVDIRNKTNSPAAASDCLGRVIDEGDFSSARI